MLGRRPGGGDLGDPGVHDGRVGAGVEGGAVALESGVAGGDGGSGGCNGGVVEVGRLCLLERAEGGGEPTWLEDADDPLVAWGDDLVFSEVLDGGVVGAYGFGVGG